MVFWSLGTTHHKGKAGDPRPTRPTEKWTTKQSAATGRASSKQEQGTRGPTVERCERCSVTESSRVQEVGEPKTHMGRHWPPAPDGPGLCDGTSSISRKVVYFVSPFLSFLLAQQPPPGPGPASISVCCTHARCCYCWSNRCIRTALQLCTITLHHHAARWPLLLLLLLCCWRREESQGWRDQKMR